MASSDKKIIIFLIHGIPTIWNENYCDIIRKHRIIGSYIGPLPKFSHEKSNFGLPLRLKKVEAKLLVDKGFAELCELPSIEQLQTPEFLEKYKAHEKELDEKQNKLALEERKAEIIKMADKILEGKLKKEKINFQNTSDLNIQSIINEEISKISGKTSKFFEIFMEHPYLSQIQLKHVDWTFPESKEDKLLYLVFKDLWEKGYTLTSGFKFGGDYLAYYGHPNDYHASFIIRCLEDETELKTDLLASWIRLGTITKKTLILASLDEDQNVHYQSFHWPNDDLK